MMMLQTSSSSSDHISAASDTGMS